MLDFVADNIRQETLTGRLFFGLVPNFVGICVIY